MVVELRRADVQLLEFIGAMDRQNYVPTGQRSQGHKVASTRSFMMEEAPYQASLIQFRYLVV